MSKRRIWRHIRENMGSRIEFYTNKFEHEPHESMCLIGTGFQQLTNCGCDVVFQCFALASFEPPLSELESRGLVFSLFFSGIFFTWIICTYFCQPKINKSANLIRFIPDVIVMYLFFKRVIAVKRYDRSYEFSHSLASTIQPFPSSRPANSIYYLHSLMQPNCRSLNLEKRGGILNCNISTLHCGPLSQKRSHVNCPIPPYVQA